MAGTWPHGLLRRKSAAPAARQPRRGCRLARGSARMRGLTLASSAPLEAHNGWGGRDSRTPGTAMLSCARSGAAGHAELGLVVEGEHGGVVVRDHRGHHEAVEGRVAAPHSKVGGCLAKV
eukprot:CAMPEP_0185175388 /NCGR_PEP_ID=MMETSP1139-20130426/26691_1 /TAXON_ID=298111 /ORGANISM="Pavlova sp., Strain CCMP459" /LENGTH=119 /DNA_ID=CAMNT_0027741125 /DNA_START=169 /DNA_END=526 /DNA_ORIENTATION=-